MENDQCDHNAADGDSGLCLSCYMCLRDTPFESLSYDYAKIEKHILESLELAPNPFEGRLKLSSTGRNVNGCNPSAEIHIRPDCFSLMSPEELAVIASYDFGTKKAQACE